ncbi:MAG TPA: copper resistance CopC family protein, partial [Candidatus Methylomirabilis sp.]
MSLTRFVGLVLAGLTILVPPRPAAGHASLVRSDPPANVLLETAPQVLRLRYDEDLAPGLSIVSILDRSNFVVLQGGSVADQDRKVLELPAAQLRPGIYTVSWKVLSAVDGHITRGAFAFTFLPPGTDPAKLLERGSAAVTRQGLNRSLLLSVQALAGWVHLIGLFVVLGGLHFPLVVLGIGRRADRETVAARERLLGPAVALVAKAVTAALISGVLWWEINTHLTSDTTLAHYLFRPALLPYLLGARTSQSMVLRLCLLLLVLVFLHEARKTSPPSLVLLGYCEAVGAVTLLAVALSSHTAGAWASPLAVLFDTLHLWAGALWVGGLVVLAVVLPRSLGESQSSGWPPL